MMIYIYIYEMCKKMKFVFEIAKTTNLLID